MPFLRPTLPQLKDRVLGDLKSRLGLSNILPRTILGIIAKVLAGASNELHGFIQYQTLQLFPETATKENLQRFADGYKLTRVPASFAAGNITFVGVGGTSVPSGTIVQRNDGFQYSVDFTTIIAGSGPTQSQAVAVTCLTSGADGNADVGTPVTMVSTLANLQTGASVSAGGLIGGVDEEQDERLRARLFERRSQPPHGGATFDYEDWAKTIPGITRAYCKPQWMGLGTVGVIVIADDIDTAPIPTVGMVDDAQDYIDSQKPVTCIAAYVFAPTPKPVNMSIQLFPNSTTVQNAVIAELKDMLSRDMEPGSTLHRSRIVEAISVATGENYNILTVPSAESVTSEPYEILTLGTITWVT